MTAFYDSPEAALARVDGDIAAARERAARASEVRASIDRVRGRARSAHDELSVEVDVTGRLRDLRLEEAAMRLSAADLAALVLRTVADAGADAGRRAVAIADDAYGAGSSFGALLRAEVEGRWA